MQIHVYWAYLRELEIKAKKAKSREAALLTPPKIQQSKIGDMVSPDTVIMADDGVCRCKIFAGVKSVREMNYRHDFAPKETLFLGAYYEFTLRQIQEVYRAHHSAIFVVEEEPLRGKIYRWEMEDPETGEGVWKMYGKTGGYA
jgi:hypothetical protein